MITHASTTVQPVICGNALWSGAPVALRHASESPSLQLGAPWSIRLFEPLTRRCRSSLVGWSAHKRHSVLALRGTGSLERRGFRGCRPVAGVETGSARADITRRRVSNDGTCRRHRGAGAAGMGRVGREHVQVVVPVLPNRQLAVASRQWRPWSPLPCPEAGFPAKERRRSGEGVAADTLAGCSGLAARHVWLLELPPWGGRTRTQSGEGARGSVRLAPCGRVGADDTCRPQPQLEAAGGVRS